MNGEIASVPYMCMSALIFQHMLACTAARAFVDAMKRKEESCNVICDMVALFGTDEFGFTDEDSAPGLKRHSIDVMVMIGHAVAGLNDLKSIEHELKVKT
jgi:hypothetical protein